MFAEIDAMTLKKWMKDGDVMLLDVRDYDEYQEGHIPQAQFYTDTDFSFGNLNIDQQKIVLYCKTSRRSGEMLCHFYEQGVKELYHLGGGYLAWQLSDQLYNA